MKEKIFEAMNEMTESVKDVVDTSIDFCPNDPITDFFPATSARTIIYQGKAYQIKMNVTIREV